MPTEDSKVVKIVDTGVANICSLQVAFERLGVGWSLTKDASEVRESEFVVLPGVGAFASAVESLDSDQLREPIIERIASDKSTLCICLGMQLLCAASEESPNVSGLGVLPFTVRRFSNSVQVPQLGWNEVSRPEESLDGSEPETFQAGVAYFANSYRLIDRPDPGLGWRFAFTDYDGKFVSSFWRSRVLACQFHPELSGDWGQQLLAKWLEGFLC